MRGPGSALRACCARLAIGSQANINHTPQSRTVPRRAGPGDPTVSTDGASLASSVVVLSTYLDISLPAHSCPLALWPFPSALTVPSSSLMAALGALDQVRRQLLRRGRGCDRDELCLAATIARVSKSLRDRTRQRVRAVLDGVAPNSLRSPASTSAIWETVVKAQLLSCGFAESWNSRLDERSFLGLVLRLPAGTRYHHTISAPCVGEVTLTSARAPAHEQDLTVASIQSLCACNAIRSLNLVLKLLGSATDEFIGALKDCASLKSLSCAQSSITGMQDAGGWFEEGIPLHTCVALQTVDFSYCYQLHDMFLEQLGLCPALTTVTLKYCTKVTDAGVGELANCRNLTDLDLFSCIKVTGKCAVRPTPDT